MTAQQLRNSILQQAIQGRLVPQDPNDEPASVLLENIRKQKEQLAKEGKLKKKDLVVTPIADDEKPFDLPSGWEWCRICDLGITNTGTTPSKTNPSFYGSYIPFVSPGDIQNNMLTYRKEGLSELGYQVARPTPAGTILQVCIGGSIGKCAICDREVTFNQQINSITPIIIDSNYIHAVLSSNYITSIMKDTTTGSATPIINKSTWENLPIPLPPLAEQRRIVAKIEELMPLVEKYGKAQSELDNLNASLPFRLRQSILQEAIQGKLVEQDASEGTGHDLLDKIKLEKEELVKLGSLKKKDLLHLPITEEEKSFDIPENWAWAKVGNIFQTYSGGTPDKGHPEYYSSNDVKWAKVGDLGSLYLSETEEYISTTGMENSSAKLYPEQTVLVAMYCNDAIGKSSVTKSVMASNQAICGLLPNANVMPEYLYYAIQYFRPSLIEKSAGGAQKNINQKIVNDIVFPLPPLAEQRRIVAKIEELFAEIDKLK